MGAADLRPHSIGKVQPYSSWTDAGQSFNFPVSTIVKQNPTPPDPLQGVLHTFTGYNGQLPVPPAGVTYKQAAGGLGATLSDTLMTPFDWLVHLDRPLVNQLELLQVTAGKPHELTLQFMVPNATGTDVVKFAGTAPWLVTTPLTALSAGVQTPAANGLLRAFDLLRVQPFGQQTAIGGRIPGRININTIMDKRVWDAPFDAYDPSINPLTGQPVGRAVRATALRKCKLTRCGTRSMASRSPNMVAKTNAAGGQLTDAGRKFYSTPVPGATIYDTNSATGDRPFLPFGARSWRREAPSPMAALPASTTRSCVGH